SLTGDALSETARAEHTFHGEWEINDDWEKGIIASLWDGGANSASSKYLTSDDTKTLYGWGAATGWMTTPPGRVIDHNRLGMAGTRTRFPCLVDGEAKAPDSLIRDPYNDFSPQDWEEMPGVWSLEELPEDHCQNPAFALNQIQFGNDDWRYISTISLFTWNGSEANVRTMDVRGMTEKKTVFIYETPGRGLAPDAPIAVDENLPEAPVLPALPEPEPRHPDATAPDGTSPVELPDPGPEGLSGVNTAAGEPGSPDALLSFGLDRDEIVTDVRLSMMRYPHAQTSWSHFFGRSTQAFADSGLRTMQGLNSSNTSIYEHSPHETPWPYDMRTDQVGATQNFLDPVPDARVAVTVPEGIQAVSPGQRLTWRTTITNGPGGTRLTPLLSVIIPNGLALDPDSIAWSDLGMVDGVEPTLRTDTVDVDGVERTRLTWSWPDAQVIDSPNREDSPDYPFHESGEVPTVTFETTAVPSVLEGTHDGRASLIAHGMDRLTPVVPPNASLPVDEWDANDNGDTGEYVGEDRVAWTAIAISGAHIAKAVTSAGDDGEWSAAGTVAASWTEDAAFRVRIRTENPNNMRLSDLVAYDVLPRDGDTAISEALQGQARGSAWTPVFAGIEETPDGMEVAYSTAENPCRPELFPSGQPGCTDDWSGTAPAKLADVTALRLTHAGIYGELDEDAPPLDLIYGMTAPPMTAAMANAATAGDPAVTNVAWRTSRISSAGEVVVLPYAEAPSASVRRDVAVIGGETWLDEDGNGHRDAAEAPVSGLPVALQDASGAAITDAAGDPVRTTSDGSYRLTVPAGSYALAFPTDADGVPLTAQLAPGEPATASVPDQKSGVSAEFSVLRTEARLDQNAGYFLADGG
ncbi:SdrD B-like domain-containing protein, partial [Leucobacter sp. M11]|uniref:SdrD B-like domain-containing protein n=1 Tax=Leucobacter sp. M11 TaxID=2993565 RepID=UPI002D7FCE28